MTFRLRCTNCKQAANFPQAPVFYFKHKNSFQVPGARVIEAIVQKNEPAGLELSRKLFEVANQFHLHYLNFAGLLNYLKTHNERFSSQTPL